MAKHVMHEQRIENAAAQRERIKQASSLQDLVRKPCKIPEKAYQAPVKPVSSLWKPEKLEQLKSMAGVVSVKNIALKLGVDESSIRNKAHKLKLSLATTNRGAHHRWTPERLEQLESLAGVVSDKEISKRLGISEANVRVKASRLGLSLAITTRGRKKAA